MQALGSLGRGRYFLAPAAGLPAPRRLHAVRQEAARVRGVSLGCTSAKCRPVVGSSRMYSVWPVATLHSLLDRHVQQARDPTSDVWTEMEVVEALRKLRRNRQTGA
jgi:hypothetical protein